MTFGGMGLGDGNGEVEGEVRVVGKGWRVEFRNYKGERQLLATFTDFRQKETLQCDLKLTPTTPHSLTIATPFDKPNHFYYNTKINLLRLTGTFSLGALTYEFNENAYAVLDWGRGVWTYNNTWYWASMSGEYKGHQIGFNLGYGFGCNKDATENVMYFDEEVYKLDDVIFNIPKNSKN